MAPTQGTRLDNLEETVQDLQTTIPELQISLDGKLSKMMRQFEESQSKMAAEQNRSKAEFTRNQEEMKNSLMMVMAELKKFNGRSRFSMEREEVISRDSQLFVEGGGFEIPHSIPRRVPQ